jgi:hypothetical protein
MIRYNDENVLPYESMKYKADIILEETIIIDSNLVLYYPDNTYDQIMIQLY